MTYLRRKVALTLGLAGAAGIVVGAVAACASAGEGGDAVDEEARAMAGCYQFRWDEGARALGLPWGFELRTEPLEEWPSLEGARTAITRPTATSAADHPFGFWRPVAGDSIMLGHPGGGGFTLTLAPEGDDLVGWGRATGDAITPGEATPGANRQAVNALRVVCPALEG